jgi:hypothetical protein
LQQFLPGNLVFIILSATNIEELIDRCGQGNVIGGIGQISGIAMGNGDDNGGIRPGRKNRSLRIRSYEQKQGRGKTSECSSVFFRKFLFILETAR